MCNYFFGKEVEGDVEIDVNSYYGIWETVDTIPGKLKNGELEFSFGLIEYVVGIPYYSDAGFLEFNELSRILAGIRRRNREWYQWPNNRYCSH